MQRYPRLTLNVTANPCTKIAKAEAPLRHPIRLLPLLVLVTYLLHAPSTTAQDWGAYKGDIVVKLLVDGRNVQVEKEFSYTDHAGREWVVPAGTTTDGASVPQVFWTLFPPFTGQYRAAAIVHDRYCQTMERSWRETHLAFYNASRAAGVPETTAKAMYGAVYQFGPRWGGRRKEPRSNNFSEEQQTQFLKDLEGWIDRDNPSPDEIARTIEARQTR